MRIGNFEISITPKEAIAIAIVIGALGKLYFDQSSTQKLLRRSTIYQIGTNWQEQLNGAKWLDP